MIMHKLYISYNAQHVFVFENKKQKYRAQMEEQMCFLSTYIIFLTKLIFPSPSASCGM
jgi:hypothetical protein